MKIGIDLDGVVFNTQAQWNVDAELYDYLKVKKNNVVNKEEPRIEERYNWAKKEKTNFINKYFDISEFPLVPGAKEVLNMLKKDGHELIVITARGKLVNGKEYALNKIKKEKLLFDKLYFEQHDKLKACLKENIDVMIDDNYHICENIAKNGISVLYFHSMDRKHIRNKKNLTEIYNWGEAYRYITEKSKEK